LTSCDIPLGCSKRPFSTPDFKALLKRESNMPSPTLMVLLALTYFLRDCRLSEWLVSMHVQAVGGLLVW